MSSLALLFVIVIIYALVVLILMALFNFGRKVGHHPAKKRRLKNIKDHKEDT